jgi:hypothetical protein
MRFIVTRPERLGPDPWRARHWTTTVGAARECWYSTEAALHVSAVYGSLTIAMDDIRKRSSTAVASQRCCK